MWNYEKFQQLYEQLRLCADGLRQYYDVGKIKTYSVYIWTKPAEDTGEHANVFDIQADAIMMYDKNHKIPEEAKPIIKNIQAKLQEISVHQRGSSETHTKKG